MTIYWNVLENLKHEIFDDPVELAPLVSLTLGLLGQLHKVFHSLQMVRWRQLARRNVSFNTFGTVLPKSPISILPAASPPIVMSNQTLCVTLGPFLASTSPPLPSRTITRISVAAQPIAWNPETIEIAPKGMKILSWMNRLIPLVHLRFSKFCSSIAFTEILTEWKINQFKTYLHYWVLSKQLQYWEGQSGGAATERGGWWLRPMRGGLAFLCQPIGRVYFWADLLLVHVPGSATHERINYGQHVSLDEMSG